MLHREKFATEICSLQDGRCAKLDNKGMVWGLIKWQQSLTSIKIRSKDSLCNSPWRELRLVIRNLPDFAMPSLTWACGIMLDSIGSSHHQAVESLVSKSQVGLVCCVEKRRDKNGQLARPCLKLKMFPLVEIIHDSLHEQQP